MKALAPGRISGRVEQGLVQRPVPMDLPTRASLLRRLQDPSDQEAWREFHERYRELLLSYAGRRGLQPSDAEDICQIVLASLTRTLPRFRYEPGRGRFRSYLGCAVRHAIQRHLEGERAGTQSLDALDLGNLESIQRAELDEDWEREWMLYHYRRALSTLRSQAEPRDVAIFEQLLDGRPIAVLASTLGMSTAAVQKVKERVRDRLKDIVAAQTELEDGDG